MKARVAFYKHTKKIHNAIISLWTWPFNLKTPPYSHVEIGIPGEEGWIYFSSTNRDGAHGTRWISEENLFKHKDRWDVYEIDVVYIEAMVIRANGMLGSQYDWAGIFGFITPFGLINSRKKWYCSEACHKVLTGIWKRRISPRRFYSYINRNFNSSIRMVSDEKNT